MERVHTIGCFSLDARRTFALMAFLFRGRFNEKTTTWGVPVRIDSVKYSYFASRGCGFLPFAGIIIVMARVFFRADALIADLD
jgi:hypothetical protein